MRIGRRSIAVAAVLAALAGGHGVAQQQSATSEGATPSPGNKTAPAPGSKAAPSTDSSPSSSAGSKDTAKKPAPADDNAFPEAQSEAAQKQDETQDAPQKATPADGNAFPEAQSEAAQKQATEQEKSDAKAADSGSASGAGAGSKQSSSSREDMKGLDLLGDNQSRIANGAGGTVIDPKLAATDLRVGQQYMQMGDLQGAYSRFKEATIVSPGDPDAVFWLAEAARKTAHLDESAENYKIYLQVEPGGTKAKAARRALAQLAGK
jgi:hypothetical protein